MTYNEFSKLKNLFFVLGDELNNPPAGDPILVNWVDDVGGTGAGAGAGAVPV